MGERYEHGQWVVDADGIAFQRCDPQSCTHLPVNDGNHTWWCQEDRSHYYQSVPTDPLTRLFTAEQVEGRLQRVLHETSETLLNQRDRVLERAIGNPGRAQGLEAAASIVRGISNSIAAVSIVRGISNSIAAGRLTAYG